LAKGDIVRLLSISAIMSGHGRHLGFDLTRNSAIRYADPKNPIEPSRKWIGWPVAEIWPFEIRHITKGAFGTPFWGNGRS